MTVPVIEVKGLKKQYGSLEAVRGVDFKIEPGEVVSILGPNGAGKTTTVEMLEGYLKPSEGFISVFGEDPFKAKAAFKKKIGIVLQESGAEPFMKVREILNQRSRYYDEKIEVDDLLGNVGLTHKANSRIAKLSGGERRRLDVALALIGKPDLIYLDEPTTGFDPGARHASWDIFKKLRTEGRTILLTTHYMDEAENLSDRVIVMSKGKVIANGSPQNIGNQEGYLTSISFTASQSIDLPFEIEEENGRFSFKSKEVVKDLNRLTTIALELNLDLIDLEVKRPSLEDVFLELINEDGKY